ARWAEGRHVERLLAALDGEANRAAQYVCELVALSPDRREVRGTGVLRGEIAHAPAGTEGFGFDPVFVPHAETQTVAELGDDWKAVHSHRAIAARALRDALGAGPAPATCGTFVTLRSPFPGNGERPRRREAALRHRAVERL